MTDHWEREVPCRDVAGRPRAVIVVIDDTNTIGLIAPAGEIAWVSLAEVQDLQLALTTAVIEATHRGAERVGTATRGRGRQ